MLWISHLLLEPPRWFPVINTLTTPHPGPLIFLYSDVHCLITTLMRLLKRSMCVGVCVCCRLSVSCSFSHSSLLSGGGRDKSYLWQQSAASGRMLCRVFSSIAIDRVLVHVLTVQRFASRCPHAHEVRRSQMNTSREGRWRAVREGTGRIQLKTGQRVQVWNQQLCMCFATQIDQEQVQGNLAAFVYAQDVLTVIWKASSLLDSIQNTSHCLYLSLQEQGCRRNSWFISQTTSRLSCGGQHACQTLTGASCLG